ncbi:MAG: addiction module protein [Cyclobacteriaceae bacterium]|jgi:putative addiction module component (TIGR02574 family)|nr:addiction module protein [Flammeovirgaceae bacterium]
MTTETIRERLHNYIESAQDNKLKAIYKIVEDEIEGTLLNEDQIAELDRRVAEYESGKVKGLSWEEVKSHAKKSLRVKKK